MNCKNCKYCVENLWGKSCDPTLYFCHRYPKNLEINGIDKHWCGEWEYKEVKEFETIQDKVFKYLETEIKRILDNHSIIG